MSTNQPFNLRKELRLALLAAMETCWAYAVLVFIASVTHVPPFASPLTLFGVYWVALILGRELPQRQERWGILQAASIFVAALLLLLVARIELYSQYGILDFGWLLKFLPAFWSTPDQSRAFYTAFAVVYVFVRGLGFGSRPLTLWFVGFQFRLGIVVFFFVFLGSAIFHPVEISRWIFIYFALSLVAIALARMEEGGAGLVYGPRWSMILLAGVALVFFLGFGLLQFFTLETTNAFLRLFTPLLTLVQAIIVLLAIPLGFIADWLIQLLRPLFSGVNKLFEQLLPQPTPKPPDPNQQVIDPSFVQAFTAFLVTLAEVAVFLGILYLIARALNRRMQQADDIAYEREALESEDEGKRAKRELGFKKKPVHRHAGVMGAETIRRIYAALIVHASDAGIPRRDAETPYEFLPRLTQEWNEQSDALRDITEAYVAVHYGERETSAQEVGRVKEAWKNLEALLKRKK